MNAVAAREEDLDLSGKGSDINVVEGAVPDVLPSIYDEQINIVVLRRTLAEQVKHYCQQLVELHPHFQLRSVINIERVNESLQSLLPELEGKKDLYRTLLCYWTCIAACLILKKQA